MEIEQPINDKVKEYCHYCVCKSCEDVKRLQAENAKLNAIIDGYQPKIQALKDENKRLKELRCKFKEVYCTCNTEKYVQCLQEIKEIANNIVYSDEIPACVNDKECPLNGGDGFDNHCNMRCPFILGKQILDLITKAEEE